MKVHERVRRYREAHGITQSWIAKQIGMSVKSYNGVELGRQRLTADVFELICKKGFKVDPGIFFDNRFLGTKSQDGETASLEPTGTEGE